MSMHSRFKEGDFVMITGPDGQSEPGFIFELISRGCSKSHLAVAFLISGKFKSLPEGHRSKVAGYVIDPLHSRDVKIVQRHLNFTRSDLESNISYVRDLTNSSFTKAQGPFLGKLTKRKSQLPMSLTAVTKCLLRNDVLSSNQLNRSEDDFDLVRITEFVKASLDGKSEGLWMNPIVSRKALAIFGIPKEFQRSGRKSVPNYDQCIIHVDGRDSARTLGMHQDRDKRDRRVSTILGCIGAPKGCGKDMILWVGKSNESMPRWWRNEGLSRECFDLAKRQCLEVREIRKNIAIVSINVGEFIFMPKGLWHWACPSEGANWSAMITSSIY